MVRAMRFFPVGLVALAGLAACKRAPAALERAPSSDAAVVAIAAASSAPANPSAADAAAGDGAVAKPAARKPVFAARATGSFDGIAWKPTFATIAVDDGEAVLAVFDAPTPGCQIDFVDKDLQFLVTVPYQVGRPTSLATLKGPSPAAKSPDDFLGKVSLLSMSTKRLAKRYAGTVELASTPSAVGDLAHAKVDIRIDGVTLKGELDAIVCRID